MAASIAPGADGASVAARNKLRGFSIPTCTPKPCMERREGQPD
jgi:hypothetical protein